MKRNSKLAMLVILGALSFNVKVQAREFTPPYGALENTVAVSSNYFIPSSYKCEVKSDKVWTIKFNSEIKFDNITKSGIVVKDSSGKNVLVGFEQGEDKKNVQVLPPQGGYKPGESYNLSLNGNVRNHKDVKLKRDVSISFTIVDEVKKDEVFGNSFGNSINNSWVAEDDNYMYVLTDEYSSIFSANIYKYNKKTKESTQLTKDRGDELSSINVVNNTIFYKKYEENTKNIGKEESSYINNLYSITADVKNQKKLIEGVKQYIASSNNIYFVNLADGDKLYRANLDGSNKVKITDDAVSNFNIVGDKVIYTKAEEKTEIGLNNKLVGAIYKINLDGTSKIMLTKNKSDNIITVGNDVYYINLSDKNKIYKVSLDGAKNVKVSDKMVEKFNINNGWIYFCNDSDTVDVPVGMSRTLMKLGTLHKMKLDGTSSAKLNNKYFRGINVLEDAIYYNEYYDDGSSNGEVRQRIEKDGQNEKMIWNYLKGVQEQGDDTEEGTSSDDTNGEDEDSVIELINNFIDAGIDEDAKKMILDIDSRKLPDNIKQSAKTFALVTIKDGQDENDIANMISNTSQRTPLKANDITHWENSGFVSNTEDTFIIVLFDENDDIVGYSVI